MAELLDYALITLDELKDYVVAEGNNSDPALTAAINAATRAIEVRLKRQLVSRGDAEVTEFHSIGWSEQFYELFVSEWPIISITSIHEDESWPRAYASGSLLAASDYEASPREGFVRRLGSAGPTYWKNGSRIVKMVYKAGYQSTGGLPAAGTLIPIPEELKLACQFVAASIYKESVRQRWGISAVTDAIGSVTRFLGYFTPEIEALINPYRRMEHHRTWEKAA